VLPSVFYGSLEVDGGPAPLPSVAGRTISFAYDIRENYTPSGGPSTVTCVTYRTSNVTDGLGGFSMPASIPGSGCTRSSCTYYSGPLAPLVFGVANATPPGYFVTSSVDGPAVTLAEVYALAQASLSPSGRATLSTDAPTPILATVQAGNGAPSPATVDYAWDLQGTDWTIVGGNGSANLTIRADDGAGPADLTLWANGTYNGTSEAAAPVELLLSAVQTSALEGNVQPTSLDVGIPALFDVRGSGAIGYSYEISIFPGIGTTPVEAACEENGTDGGTEDVNCETPITYNSTGIVQPSAELTNGYSSAPSSFPTLTIDAAPAVAVTPFPVVAYVEIPTAITVSVAPSTGTQPIGPACLSTGNGREPCVKGPGPSYAFEVAWGSAGAYTAIATVADGAHANVSVKVPVEIYAQLNATWSSSGALNPGYLGDSYNLSASVRGGAMPLRYWWNTSGGTLMYGTLDADGSLYYPYIPESVGWANVSLVVLDALGTRDSVAFPALVVPGTAVQIGLGRGEGAGTVTAGTPYELQWEALDSQGVVTPQYQAPETFEVTDQGPGPARPVWVNGSGGAVPSGAAGMFSVPPSDWSSGYLDLNVTVGGDGSFALALVGGLPQELGLEGAPTLHVTTNLAHLRLWDPRAVGSDDRSSNTLYRITDDFDDNVTGGHLQIRSLFGSLSATTSSVIEEGPNGSTAWVNITALSASSGTVNVTYDGAGPSILLVAVPAAPAPFPWASVALIALGIAGAAALAALVVVRRRRSDDPSDEVPPATEADLRRLSEGRAHILAHADPTNGRTLDELAKGFPDPPPTPEEVTEWVASLVADGSLMAELASDGRSRFRLAAPPPAPPKVELDDRVLEDALRRQTEREDDVGAQAPERSAPEGPDP
jgi:hypothetical protein